MLYLLWTFSHVSFRKSNRKEVKPGFRVQDQPEIHLEKRAVAFEEASFLDEYEGGRSQQILPRILS
jgi:hypothetical protein